MTLRRLVLAAVFAATVAFAVGTPPASAQYSPLTGTLQVSPSSTTSGGTVTVRGTGFAPGATVTIAVASTVVATVTADSTGAISTSVRLPTTLTGTQTITATGSTANGSTLELRGTVVITASATNPIASSSASLPVTGHDPFPLGQAGLAAIGIGVLLLLARRGRRQESTAS